MDYFNILKFAHLGYFLVASGFLCRAAFLGCKPETTIEADFPGKPEFIIGTEWNRVGVWGPSKCLKIWWS
jgi:hypothetical protein